MARRLIALATVLAAVLWPAGSAHAQAGPSPEQAARVDVARGEGERLAGELARLRTRADELRRSFDADRTRVRFAQDASGPVSEVFLRHRDALPAIRDERRQLADVRAAAARCELDRLDAAEAQDGALEEVLARNAALHADLEAAVVELDEATESYRAFLDAQLFWIPDMPAVGTRDVGEALGFLRTAVSKESIASAAGDLRRSVTARPAGWVLSILAVLLLLDRGRALGSWAGRILPEAATRRRIPGAGRAALDAVINAVPFPLALWLSGTLLLSTGAGDSMGAFAHAIAWAAVPLAWLLAISATCAPGGLAERHLGWTPAVCASIRRSALLAAQAVVPAVLVSRFASWSADVAGSREVSRLATAAALALLALVSARIFSPRHGVFAGVISRVPSGWVATFAPFLHAGLTSVPAAFAIAAAFGYQSTASFILDDLLRSYAVVFVVAVGLSAFDRVGHGAIDRLTAHASAMDAEEEARFDRQVRSFGRLVAVVLAVVGLLWAWRDQVPALWSMASTPVWSVGGSPATATAPAIAPTPVTAGNLVVFAAIAVLTVVVVRDLPGLLNALVLRRFPIDRSLRYALVSLARNVLVLVGLVASLGALQIRWADVQWLAAGVTVGLGFGLQEVFANFVSGIILLTERPVRVGDLVTVGGSTGRVARISTRATTLVDFDNKDVVIPNKSLITEPITNWTLNDANVRDVLKVGVAYGSDLSLVTRTLEEAVLGIDGVLRDPAPRAFLAGFGASSIDFDVLFHISADGGVREVKHDVGLRIDRLLRERGIEIAFPQLDVHVKSMPAAGGRP
jgi:potassium efflux system protein